MGWEKGDAACGAIAMGQARAVLPLRLRPGAR